MKENNLETMIGAGENILWKGKPSKKCFLLESIFNPMLPFALIWALFDSLFIGGAFLSKDITAIIFILLFMLFHLMPVWIYLGGIFLSSRKFKNTEYIITDKGIYISGGIFTYNFEMKPFTDLSHISIRRGIFDQKLGVGDVISVCSHPSYNTYDNHSTHSTGFNICDIPDYVEVFNLIKKLQTDIYSDTMYPNDKRPSTNHGYNTKYINDKNF